MNLYLIGGYVFDLSSNLKFKPAFLGKVVEGAPLQLDLSGNFLINEKFVLGAVSYTHLDVYKRQLLFLIKLQFQL